VGFEKHVKVRQERFGAVVFETLREKVFVTDEIGAEILRLLEEKRELKDVLDELAKNYDCNPETIKGDVDEFILALKDNGIIKEEK